MKLTTNDAKKVKSGMNGTFCPTNGRFFTVHYSSLWNWDRQKIVFKAFGVPYGMVHLPGVRQTE